MTIKQDEDEALLLEGWPLEFSSDIKPRKHLRAADRETVCVCLASKDECL